MSNFKRVVAVQDESSHWYVIPKSLEKDFYKLQEQIDESWEEFEEKFSQYMTGGDLNLIELYIKEDE